MDDLLAIATLLDNRYRIADLIGHGEGTAAYLAADLDQGGAWTVVWESLEMFRMRQKPSGVLSYLNQGDRHYLVLQLEGQDLGMIYAAAGIVVGDWAALWLAQVSDGIGQWHIRSEDRLVCLESGDIRLSDLRLTATGRALLPSCELLSQPPPTVVAAQSLAFSAPEKMMGGRLTIQSDVYALASVLYCLVTGTLPPDPRDLAEGRLELPSPRKIQRGISGRLEKVILKAMSLEPERRHESAMQLSFELDRFIPRRLRRHQIGAF